MTNSMTFCRPDRARLLLLGVGLLLGACSASYREVPPQINLVDLRFTDITVFETAGVMVLRLSNENPDPLAIEGGVYELFIDGRRLGRALSDRNFAIPRLASETVEVPFRIGNLAFATRLKGIIDRGSFDYRLEASVYVASHRGRKTLHVEKGGYFDFAEARSPARRDQSRRTPAADATKTPLASR